MTSMLFVTHSVAQALTGKLESVATPSTVVVKLRDHSLITLTLAGPDFGELGQHACYSSKRVTHYCHAIEQRLSRKVVGVILEGVNNGQMVGDLVIDGELISERLVADGIYRADGNGTRALHLLKAEAQARCAYKGLWKSEYGNPRVARHCQQQ